MRWKIVYKLTIPQGRDFECLEDFKLIKLDDVLMDLVVSAECLQSVRTYLTRIKNGENVIGTEWELTYGNETEVGIK